MGNDDLLTDDYVADLLAKEANDCSLKYSAMGMEAFRTDKKPKNLPKPNTRFLRHIIKNTDSHNKALLAREAAESQARLGDLEHAAEAKRQKLNPDSKSIRKRQMGDIHAILGVKKKSDRSEGRSDSRRDRDEDRSTAKSDKRERETKSRDHAHRERTTRISRETRDSERRRRDERRRRGDVTKKDSKGSRRHRSRSRSRSSSRSRSRSPRHTSSARQKEDKRSSRRHRSPVESRGSPLRKSKHQLHVKDQDSDPLEDLIGPAPAPKYRGRGNIASSSGIDRRFSESYDPKADVDMDDVLAGESNWDDAVEAFRDRQKLRQHQEERLRAAGFGDDELHKKGGDFKWSRSGEKRAWDQGKEDDKEPPSLFREFSDEEG